MEGRLEYNSRQYAGWAMLAILMLALLLRLPGHFYPVALHYDEGADVQTALSYARGSLHPDNLAHPALNTYLIFLAEATYYTAGRLLGKFSTPADFLQAYETERSGFLYIGRSVSLLAGLLTIFLTYHLGRQLWSPSVGVGGALLLAVSPLHILVSNNIRQWSLGTCFTTLAFCLLIRHWPVDKRWPIMVAGVAIGLAIASIYVLGLLLLPLAVALGIRWRVTAATGSRPRWIGDILAAGVGVLIGFGVGNFGVLLAWQEVLATLSQYLTRDSAHSTSSYLTNVSWYVVSLWDVFGMGLLLASVGAVAFLWANWRASAAQWIVLSFVWSVFLIQPAALFFWSSRYTVTVYPILLLTVSALIVGAWAQVTAARPALRCIPGSVLALFLLITPNLLTVVEYHTALRRTPTQVLARQWVESHLPSGTKLVLNLKHMSPVVPLGTVSLQNKYRKHGYAGLALNDTKPHYEVVYLQLHNVNVGNRETVFQEMLHRFTSEGFSYVIYTDVVPPAVKLRLRRKDFVREWLDARYPLINRFVYTDLSRPTDNTATIHPEIRVYQVLGHQPKNAG